jgi:DNA-binding MarR family transcriptional regulator
MTDKTIALAVSSLRGGTMRLGRRLRLERPEHAVTSAELSVLGLLHRRGPMSAGDLASAEQVQPQSLTRTLATLAERGQIRRSPDPADRRRSLVSITELGTEGIIADVSQRDRWLAMAMAEELSLAEIHLLMMAGELMERLAESEVKAPRRATAARGRRSPAEAARRGDGEREAGGKRGTARGA